MPSKIDLLGRRFGSLVVTCECPERTLDGKVRWICDCDCGNEHVASGRELRAGKTKRCSSCTHKRLTATGAESLRATHGLCKSPEYKVWASILDRCTNPNDKSWQNYGGRGVRVCDRWLNSFEAFYADMGPRPQGTGKGGRSLWSVERNDVNGDYCPENCRWATNPDQARNRNGNVWLEWNGQRMCQSDAAVAAGLTVGAVIRRRGLGWPEELLLAPKGTRFVSKEEFGQRVSRAMRGRKPGNNGGMACSA